MSSMDTNENCCNQDQDQDQDQDQIQVLDQEIEQDPDLEKEFYLNKEENSQARLDICKQCPELFGPLNNCRQCGCFMNIKVRIYSASCPLGKW